MGFNWVKGDNTERPHSGIGYKTPIEVFKKGGQLDIIKLKLGYYKCLKMGAYSDFF